MEIEFYGANCFKIKTKQATIVVDDDLESHGGKTIVKDGDVLVVTSKILDVAKARSKARLVLDSAGEFEVGDISVNGIQTRAHMDEKGTETATVFQCLYAGTSITIMGHIHPDLTEAVQELAGGTDVMLVPVGGNGFTVDAVGAVNIIKSIEPDMVIPSQYEVKGMTFEVPPAPLEDFVKTSGLTVVDAVDSLKVGKALAETSQTQLVILNVK